MQVLTLLNRFIEATKTLILKHEKYILILQIKNINEYQYFEFYFSKLLGSRSY